MDQEKKKRNIWIRVSRIAAKIVLYTILFFLIFLLLIQTAPVQSLIRKKVVAYLENRLDTRIEVGRIFVTWPKNIVLDDVYLEDRQKDTLLSGESIVANLNIWQLVVNNRVNINSLAIENVTIKVKRDLPDTIFNFQFIVDAFKPKKSGTVSTDSIAPMSVETLTLDKIRFIFKDVITGTDAVAWLEHMDTRVNSFNPQQLVFDIPRTHIKGLMAKFYQSKPLLTADPLSKDIAEAREPIYATLNLKELTLDDVQVDYRNDVSSLYSYIKIDKLGVRAKNIDLKNRIIDLEDILLDNTTANIRIGKKQTARVVVKEVKQEAIAQAEAGWRIMVNDLKLNNNNFIFDNENEPRQKYGMDYAHLNAEGFNIDAQHLLISKDSIGGSIGTASFREKSGFVLNKLSTDFLYSPTQTYLHDLYFETPGTTLKRSAEIRYASIRSLSTDIGNMFIDLDLDQSKLLVSDLLTFVPALRFQPAFAYPGATWYLNSRATGRLADLRIDELQVNGLNNTRIDIAGNLSGLPDMKNMSANLVIRNISSSKRDLNLFLPKNTIPQNITLPERFVLQGTLKGNSGLIYTNLGMQSDLGNAVVKGSFRNPGNPSTVSYDATLYARGLNIGTILQNPEIRGPVSATISAKGKGFDPKTAHADFNAIVHAATINQYTYHNFKMQGSLDKGFLNADASIVDPNIHFAVNAKSNITDTYPAITLSGMIDSIKLQALHFTTFPLIYRGKIDADFPVTNPDRLEGQLYLTQTLFVQNDQRLQLDTVRLLAGRSDSGQYLRLNSDVMNAEIEGRYQLSNLAGIFQQAIDPYFSVGPVATRKSVPYDFVFNAYVVDNPALKVFFPTLKKMDSVSLQSHFSDQQGWWATLDAPLIEMGPNKYRNLKMKAGTGQNEILVDASIQGLASGPNIRLDNTTVTARIANNKIDFTLNSKDRGKTDKYRIKALLEQPRNGQYIFSIKPDSLLLNYEVWTVMPNNRITIGTTGINASNLVLSQGSQQLTINSTSTSLTSPLDVTFSNFRLATLTGFVQTDSTFANGLMNGKISFVNITKDPVFTGDLTINDFSYQRDTLGNIHALVNNRVANTYATDITLSGRGNDVKLTGNYYLKPDRSSFDYVLDLRSLPITTVQSFSKGAISGGSGAVKGRFDVKGTLASPEIIGDLNFDKAGFNITTLNSYFTVDQEKIRVDREGLHFDRFAIRDSAQNALTIDGIAATRNFSNYQFNLDVNARNFRALNSTKKNNSIFYGKLYFDTDVRIRGTETAPDIDGDLVVNDKTRMTIVLPQRDPRVLDREGIVEFVDMDSPINDSLFLAAYDSLNVTPFKGMDIAMNFEIVKEAEFNLIIDEGNGDFLNVKGEALLTGGIDPSGKINLSGSYELEQGSYELSFNFLRRKFEIQRGSRITWEGEPTSATVDVSAVYVANAPPLDLVKDQLTDASAFQRNTYLQKLPFDVKLKMEGQLMQPQISFDIVLPEKNYVVAGDIITNVRTRLDQLRQEEGEMNKQVFSLLLMNRFIGDNPFNSNAGPNPAAYARQSVSKLLTEQLNRLAGDLVGGMNLNFDVVSSEDYTTGERRDRTDLNVGLSKKLLNDRLTVSIGSNFELEGPQKSNQQSSNIAGNIGLDYRISRDNRYLLRAYRKNEYEGVIDGYIIETGVAFIITVDYNRFRELFLSRKEREQRRQRRQFQREQDREQKSTATQPPAIGTL